MAEKHNFLFKIFSWISKKEVKTPLSFVHRLIAGIVILASLVLWLISYHGLARAGLIVFFVTLGALLLLAVGVGVFAWNRPKNLVYGEIGYRAETKMGLGTEHRIISEEELATIQGVPNQQVLPPTNGDKSLAASEGK